MCHRIVDELRCFEFHEAVLQFVAVEGNNMIWEIGEAAVIGTSFPETEKRITCPQNPGADRIAKPILKLTFQGYGIQSLLRGGIYSTKEGAEIEIEPPRFLDSCEYIPTLTEIAQSPGNAILSMNQGHGYKFALWGGEDPQYYELCISAGHVIAEWADYGDEAWYLNQE